jgi:hypothetical protein
MQEPIHKYLPESLCAWVEQRYYAQINAQARLRSSLAISASGKHRERMLACFPTMA